jgi:hypothetical protein
LINIKLELEIFIMPSISIVCGVLLIIVGVAAYLISDAEAPNKITALIPALFGLILIVLGAASRAKENLRKHLMHVAVLVGLLGFMMSAGRLLMNFSKLTLNLATITLISMSVVCLIFVILCVKSFADARRNRAV